MGVFDSSKEGVVGIDGALVNSAVTNLEDSANNLTQWNNELVELRDLVANEWYGGASDQFKGSYEQLAMTMQQMITAARVLRDFSQTTADSYAKGDSDVSDMVGMALRIQ